VALGEDSMHFRLAHLAYEFKISPSELLMESDRMLWTMERYLHWRNTKANQAQRKR
jgi:hypothetical protein